MAWKSMQTDEEWAEQARRPYVVPQTEEQWAEQARRHALILAKKAAEERFAAARRAADIAAGIEQAAQQAAMKREQDERQKAIREACFMRQQEKNRLERLQKAEAQRIQEKHNEYLKAAEAAAGGDPAKISTVQSLLSGTEEEAEAVLAHLFVKSAYKKNTMLAFQAINRFSAKHGLTQAQAEAVLRE